jgi:hypothetical protein
MKNKSKLTLLFSLCISVGSIYGQESSNASGGDAIGSGGTVAYTIGQVVYTYESVANGNSNQGVQQPYEIYSIGVDEQLSNISLMAYPNPTSGYLTLELLDYSNEKIEYQLIDIEGKVILSKLLNDSQTQVDLNIYSKGIYFIKVIKESKEIRTFKIIKN